MLRFIGWLLLLTGLIFAIGSSIHPERYSQIYSDSVYKAYSQLYVRDGRVGSEDMKLALNALARELDSSRRVGFIFISVTMALGAIILSRRRRTIINVA